MPRSRRIKRKTRKRINWFFVFLVILFTFTFKPTSFDIEPTIFINTLVFKPQSVPSLISAPIDVDVELSKVEDLLEKGQLLLAKDKLDRLIAKGVTGGRLHLLLGMLYDKMSKEYREKSISEFRMSALYKDTKDEALYELGKVYFANRAYGNAKAVFTKIENTYKNDPVFLKYLGMTYVEEGEYTKGKKILERALKLAPKDEEIKRYLTRIKILTSPSPSPTKKMVVERSSIPSSLFFEKKVISSYFDMEKEYEGDIFVVSEDISVKVSLDGSYKETVHRVVFVKNPKILKEGIKFRYNKKYVNFSLFLLKGFKRDGKEIPEDKFDYIIKTDREENGVSYEDAIISLDTKEPIILEYRLEVNVKPVVHGKFQFLFTNPSYPIKNRRIEFLIPQGLSFNIYPKNNVQIEDKEDYKRVLFSNPSDMIILNNFTTWIDVWKYGSTLLKDINISLGDIENSPEAIYNKIVSYYNILEREDMYLLFIDSFYNSLKKDEGNLLLSIFLYEKYVEHKFKVKRAILEPSSKIGFPLFEPNIKSLLFFPEDNIYLEPCPLLIFGIIEPNIEKVYLIDSGEIVKLPLLSYNRNIKEDYLKLSLSNLDTVRLISYTQGLFDFFYRGILYRKNQILNPNIWFLEPDLAIYKVEPSDINRLDIPFQAVVKVSLNKNLNNMKFSPPYIYPVSVCNFPFILKRRMEIFLGEYRIKEIPNDIIIDKKGFIYKVKFSLSSDNKKIFIENTFILKDRQLLSKIAELKKILSKSYIFLNK